MIVPMVDEEITSNAKPKKFFFMNPEGLVLTGQDEAKVGKKAVVRIEKLEYG